MIKPEKKKKKKKSKGLVQPSFAISSGENVRQQRKKKRSRITASSGVLSARPLLSNLKINGSAEGPHRFINEIHLQSEIRTKNIASIYIFGYGGFCVVMSIEKYVLVYSRGLTRASQNTTGGLSRLSFLAPCLLFQVKINGMKKQRVIWNLLLENCILEPSPTSHTILGLLL